MGFPPATVPPDTAITQITSKFLSVVEEETTGEVRKLAAGRAKEFEVIDYVYVADEIRILHGRLAVPLRVSGPRATWSRLLPDPAFGLRSWRR